MICYFYRTAAESLITMQVMQALAEALKAIGKGYVFKVFKDLEMPIQTSLLKMELKGFGVNESHLYELSEKVTRLLKTLEETIYEVNGRKFNLTSSKDVAQVLGIYKNLQIARSKRVSTSKKVLSKLEMPLADLIMQYRKMSAILSNSVQPLLNSIQNNRIFGKSFSLTQTGRISMYDPNLQNVSKDFQLSYTGEIFLINVLEFVSNFI